MTILKTKGLGHVLSDRNSWNVQVIIQHQQRRKWNFKQSFQDYGINIIQRRPSQSQVVPDRNSAI
jgi:hypothetical protein